MGFDSLRENGGLLRYVDIKGHEVGREEILSVRPLVENENPLAESLWAKTISLYSVPGEDTAYLKTVSRHSSSLVFPSVGRVSTAHRVEVYPFGEITPEASPLRPISSNKRQTIAQVPLLNLIRQELEGLKANSIIKGIELTGERIELIMSGDLESNKSTTTSRSPF